MLPSQEARQRFLPLCLHGDAGAFQKNDSIHEISVRSLLSRQNVATAQLLLLALPKGAISKCPGDPSSSTMHHVWSVIKWSFEAAYFNKFPETDHMGKAWPQYSWRSKMAGQPLNSDGHSALLFAIQGDAEYLLKSPRRKSRRFNLQKANALRSGGSQTFKKTLCKTFGTRMWQKV